MQPVKTNPELRHALGILARDPENVAANIQAGVYYSQDKLWEKSIFHLKKALRGDKKNTLILEKLADVLLKQHLYKDARMIARRLLNLNKRAPTALLTMARVNEALGDIDKAILWIDKALDIDLHNKDMLFEKAKYYSFKGNIDKSIDIHQQIVKLHPLFANSWWPIAQLQKYQGDGAKNILAKINAAIAASENDGELRGLHYAAGKVHQDIEAYQQAFEHFTKANILHDVDIGADKIIAANINFRETYSPELFKSKSTFGNQDYRPVFILGQTRSGTTLVESLCAAHSRISAGGELINMSKINEKLEVYSLLAKGHRQIIHQLDRRQFKAFSDDYLAKTAHLRSEGTGLTDKMPHNFLNIGLIALLYPNAKFIHCRRHPMDNCLSIFSNPMLDYHKEYKSDLRVLGEYYRNYVQIMDFWKETCPISIHDVLYEDMVTNTQAVARGMMEYLDLPWEDGVMDRSGSQKTVKTLSVWQVRQPVFQTSKGKWRNYEKQLQPLRDVLGDCIEEYEAELAQLDKPEPGGKTQ